MTLRLGVCRLPSNTYTGVHGHASRCSGPVPGLHQTPVFGLPDWIWIDSHATAEGVVFYHDFDVDPARLQSAHLRLVTDFTNVKLTINGQQAGIAEAFRAGPEAGCHAIACLLGSTRSGS